jgi:hypothetical protein
MKASEKLLAAYTEELLPCTSFLEFCDVTGIYYLIFFTNCHGLYFFLSGLLDVITSPDTYISDLLKELP